MDEVRRKGFWAFELFSWMFGIFGGLALVLGSAGVYGVLSSPSRSARRNWASGSRWASTRDVLALTVGQGLKLVAAGVVAGVVGAAAVTRFIGTLLYDVTPTDPVSFAAVIGVLAGSACWRATSPRAVRCASIRSRPCGASRSAGLRV